MTREHQHRWKSLAPRAPVKYCSCGMLWAPGGVKAGEHSIVTTDSNIQVQVATAPSNPSAGFGKIYAAVDKQPKWLASDGTSTSMYGSGGGTSTEVLALTAAQVNVSSIGDTYTDVAGDTYAETASQTRLTMSARLRIIIATLSGHVSANTGTFELFNFTDTASLATATTTSTGEALLTGMSSQLDTNISDAITIRVKNSVALGTTTIDGGGMAAGDSGNQNVTTVGSNGVALVPGNTYGSAWIADTSTALLKTPSTGTCTITIAAAVQNNVFSATVTPVDYDVGASFGTAEANTVVTRTPSQRFYKLQGVVSAIGASNRWGFAWAMQVKADDI